MLFGNLVVAAISAFVISDVVEPVAPDAAAVLDVVGYSAAGGALGAGVGTAIGGSIAGVSTATAGAVVGATGGAIHGAVEAIN